MCPVVVGDVRRMLGAVGLRLCGGFAVESDDDVPALIDGRPARTVLMVGNAGPAMWRHFGKACPPGLHPLDNWTREVIARISTRLGASAVFPFQRPYLPFQRWGIRSGSCHSSPLGILIHARFGLWHALRGALLFSDDVPLPVGRQSPSPCNSCGERPCLNACPVKAFGNADGYDVPACIGHLRVAEGHDCMAFGCRARRSCPVGRVYRYDSDQAHFHMEAFLSAFR
jgi:ferredoxin